MWKMIMVNAVFFDFGGTLDTDGIHWSEKFWDIYQKYNININKQDYEYAYVEAENSLGGGDLFKNKSFKDILSLQISAQFDVLKKKNIIKDTEYSLLDEMIRNCYDDVKKSMSYSRELLKTLSEQYTLGIISNFYGNLKHVCKEFELNNYLTFFIDSEIVGIRKPDTGIYKLAVNSMHTNPEEVVMIGDSYERDIVPAKSIGCKTVWLKGRSWREEAEDNSKADYIINSIREIPCLNLFEY
jgi:putative hydrolase of the HAD superfamily